MTDPVNGDDELPSLVEAARAGQPAALERLLRRIERRVHRWAARYTDDADAADDVTQDVLIGLERRLALFRGRSRFSTWLFVVTRNAALNYRRRQARDDALRARAGAALGMALEQSLMSTPQAEDAGGFTTLVLAELEALPPKQRQIFELVDLRGLQPAEVARTLGMRQATVRADLFKARRAIRARIVARHEDYLEEYRS